MVLNKRKNNIDIQTASRVCYDRGKFSEAGKEGSTLHVLFSPIGYSHTPRRSHLTIIMKRGDQFELELLVLWKEKWSGPPRKVMEK
jgi:hypothetical protein